MEKKLPNKENKDIFGFEYYIFFFMEGGEGVGGVEDGIVWHNLEKIFIREVNFINAIGDKLRYS